ncbi:MAG: hypothetical protein ACQERC_13260 [Bacteroidota bacterium]
MSSLTLKDGFQSPIGYISNLIGNSIENFLMRKLSDVKDNLVEIEKLESEHLEALNNYKDYKVGDLDGFEDEIKTYGEISELFKKLDNFINVSKAELNNDDAVYSDFILLHNQIKGLLKTLNKVTKKLSEIHNKILVKSSESMSSDVLKDLWKDEEDVWDDFYRESQS